MEVVKISVIVPVFNAAEYIETSIQSILNQSLVDLEVIVINDGSTDTTLNILEKLAARDNRIVLINSANEGVSAARNKGIRAAKGVYIGFVDADDWIEPGMYETMYATTTEVNASIAVCNVCVVKEDGSVINRLKLKDETIELDNNEKKELVKLMRFEYDYAIWNKLYKTAIIRNNHLQFNESIKVWEDLLFNLCYFQFAEKISVINKPMYHYRVHPASVMNTTNHDTVEEFNKLFNGFTQFCTKNNLHQLHEVFVSEMGRSFYYTLIPKLYARINNHEWPINKKVSVFKKQLKQVNEDVFKFGNEKLKGVQGFKKTLLRKRRFHFFSLLVNLNGIRK